MKKLTKVQKETMKDVKRLLTTKNRCLLIRPTGFGKTHIALSLSERYKRVVYMVPNKGLAESINKSYIKDNMVVMTYSMLVRMYKNIKEFVLFFNKYNADNILFVFDEAHRIAAEQTSKAVHELMKICVRAKFLGMTATPSRLDGRNILYEFFESNQTYQYGIKNAVEDNIIRKPYYIYTPLNIGEIERMMINKINKAELSVDKRFEIIEKIESINPRHLEIENISDILLDNLKLFNNKYGYFKFICFFTNFNSLHIKSKQIIDGFKEAFPTFTINPLIVSSETHEYIENRNKISSLKLRKNTIDLILCVNMLTHGFHLDNLSGIIMMRHTFSDIIYKQQTGRCMSVIDDNPKIIFDFVENLYTNINVNPDWGNADIDDISNIFNLPSMDSITLYGKIIDILEIDRLINEFSIDEIIDEVIDAYRNGLVDINYCTTKLKMTEDYFMKIAN